MTPCVRSNSRSSRRVDTVFGSRMGGGGGGEDAEVVSRVASSRLEAEVLKVEEWGLSCDRWIFCKHLKAGRIVYIGTAILSAVNRLSITARQT